MQKRIPVFEETHNIYDRKPKHVVWFTYFVHPRNALLTNLFIEDITSYLDANSVDLSLRVFELQSLSTFSSRSKSILERAVHDIASKQRDDGINPRCNEETRTIKAVPIFV